MQLKTCVILSAFLLICSPLAMAKKPPKWLFGNWYGVGYQLDDKTWDVELTANADGISVSYPDLRCGGSWLIADKKRSRVTVTETLEYGLGNCDQGVRVQVTKVSDHEVNLSFVLKMNGRETLIAFANLVRPGTPTPPLPFGIYRKVN